MKYLYLFFAIIFIAILTFFSLEYWHDQYPNFLEFYDIAFHASNAVGLERCGGWTLTNFWAGAGKGAPNTYLPFFQLLSLLIIYASNAGVFFLTYWVNWMFLPLSFLSLLLFAYKAYGPKAALYSVILLGLSPVWMDKQWGMPPQALVYVLTPFVFLALVKKRFLTVFLLTLCCATAHFTGILLIPFLLLYAFQNSEVRRPVLIVVGAILLISAPFIWFILQRIEAAELSIALLGNTFLSALSIALHQLFNVKQSIHVYLGWLAAAGFIICYFRRKDFLILPSYFLVFFPLALTVQQIRFWGAPALFILALLGGVALGALHGWVERIVPKAMPRGVPGFIFFIFIFFALNGLFYYISGLPSQLKRPSMVYLKSPDLWLHPRTTFNTDDKRHIIGLVREFVPDDEYFWIDSSNAINNYVAMNTNRSTVTSITHERKGTGLMKGIRLVVARALPSAEYKKLEDIDDRFTAYILADPSEAAKVRVPPAIVGIHHIEVIFIVLGVLIMIDVFGFRPQINLGPREKRHEAPHPPYRYPPY